MMANGKVTKKRGEGVSDGAYLEWIADLKRRYRRTQIKAAVAVNSAMLEFYWSLGKDISGKYPGKKRNLGFFDNLSSDLCLGIKNPVGLSARNLRYSLAFYQLYSCRQQVVADNGNDALLPQIVEDNGGERYLQQVVADNCGTMGSDPIVFGNKPLSLSASLYIEQCYFGQCWTVELF